MCRVFGYVIVCLIWKYCLSLCSFGSPDVWTLLRMLEGIRNGKSRTPDVRDEHSGKWGVLLESVWNGEELVRYRQDCAHSEEVRWNLFLPPAYLVCVVCEKVIFSVCLSTGKRGPTVQVLSGQILSRVYHSQVTFPSDWTTGTPPPRSPQPDFTREYPPPSVNVGSTHLNIYISATRTVIHAEDNYLILHSAFKNTLPMRMPPIRFIFGNTYCFRLFFLYEGSNKSREVIKLREIKSIEKITQNSFLSQVPALKIHSNSKYTCSHLLSWEIIFNLLLMDVK